MTTKKCLLQVTTQLCNHHDTQRLLHDYSKLCPLMTCFSFATQPGMKRKLEQIAQELDWLERMDVTVTIDQDEEGVNPKTSATSTPSSEKSLHDDFQQEMRL